MKNLPAPCKECAFRRDISPGALGGSSPLVYIGQTHAPFQIPCHKACDFSDPNWREASMEVSQCAGSAVFRANLGIRNLPEALQRLPQDHNTVFSSAAEFLAHHQKISVAGAEEFIQRVGIGTLVKKELSSSRLIVFPVITPQEKS